MAERRLLLVLLVVQMVFISNAKKKVSIPDNLDDVMDDEEDEEWKAWGSAKKKDPVFDPPPDFSAMTPLQIQQEMLKRHIGPSMGFVKLRLDIPRTKEELPILAKKWTRLLRTGGIGAKVTAVDLNTMMFTIDHGQDIMELKDFILNQEESYEFKVGQQVYRRPGDPPLEVVLEKRRRQKKEHTNDEL